MALVLITISNMASQKDIAQRLGVTQAAVSMALRNHPRVSLEMRERVREVADQLGYRPHPYVKALMTAVREGRSPQDFGCIAILVDEASVEAWLGWHPETYSSNFQGYCKEAQLHGFRAECFCLRALGDSPESIDRRLQARGVRGIILAAPRLPNKWKDMNVDWSNYAIAAVSHTWEQPNVDRVTTHHLHNMKIAFSKLVERGCRRIGFCQPTPSQIRQVPSLWIAGYLMSQWEHSDLCKLEPFVGTIHDSREESFHQWFKRWKPDGLITAVGDEASRLGSIGVSTEGHRRKGVQLVCLNRPKDSRFSGIDENNELVGRKACAAVVNRIMHNQYGIPEHADEVVVPGTWVDS